MGTILVGKMSKNIKTIKTIQFSQLIGAFKKKKIYIEKKKRAFFKTYKNAIFCCKKEISCDETDSCNLGYFIGNIFALIWGLIITSICISLYIYSNFSLIRYLCV